MFERLPQPNLVPEKSSSNPLLAAPDSINPEDIKLGDHVSSFSGDHSKYSLGMRQGKPYLIVEYYGELPEELSEEEKNQFIWEPRKINGKIEHVYTIRYGNAPQLSQEEQEIGPNIPASYYIAPPRKFEHFELGSEQLWSAEQIAEYLRNNKAIFYTGAGLSKSAAVPDMAALQSRLGISHDKPSDDFLRQAIRDPDALLKTWVEFNRAMAEDPATAGHQALTNIAKKLQCKILTENIDMLHERAGIRAFHVSAEGVRENIDAESLKEIDAIIAVGLSADDRGLLAWYKTQNPTGKIIAINISQPKYLGENDVLVVGDAQKILPEIEEKLQH